MRRPEANTLQRPRPAGSRRPPVLLAGLALLGLMACNPLPGELGERIYQTGLGADGRIVYEQGPRWLHMARGGCAVCHGREGQGLAMRAGDSAGAAPPLTPDYLAARGYDRETLGHAITRGIDPDGRTFSYYMPRWRLDQSELDALLDYLARL